MRTRVSLRVLSVVLVAHVAASAAQSPVAVSPGDASKLAIVESRCPTFSWGAIPAAERYELLVYRLGEEGEEAQPVLRQDFAGSVYGWTPSLDRCLERGGQYAWSIRAEGRKGLSEWSAPSLFEVAAGPNEAEFEEALVVVRQYLAASGQADADVPDQSEFPSEKSLRAASNSLAPLAPATTQLSVDGNIAASSFTGDGENLAGVATDVELSTHAGLPNVHHAPTVDTLLSEGQVEAFVTNGPLDGSQFTALNGSQVITGTVAEARIANEIVRTAELLPGGGSGILRLIQCASNNGWRYWNLADGTVLDCNTGLIWLKDASCAELAGTDTEGRGVWSTAQAAAAALSSGTCGLTDGSVAGDWHQPTISELCSAGPIAQICPAGNASDSLVDSTVSGGPKVVNADGTAKWSEGDAFVGVQSSPYWSATELGSNAWFVFLGDGNVGTDFKGDPDVYVWPVRGGQ